MPHRVLNFPSGSEVVLRGHVLLDNEPRAGARGALSSHPRRRSSRASSCPSDPGTTLPQADSIDGSCGAVVSDNVSDGAAHASAIGGLRGNFLERWLVTLVRVRVRCAADRLMHHAHVLVLEGESYRTTPTGAPAPSPRRRARAITLVRSPPWPLAATSRRGLQRAHALTRARIYFAGIAGVRAPSPLVRTPGEPGQKSEMSGGHRQRRGSSPVVGGTRSRPEMSGGHQKLRSASLAVSIAAMSHRPVSVRQVSVLRVFERLPRHAHDRRRPIHHRAPKELGGERTPLW